MPRSGVVGTYTLPPGTTPQQPNTVIQSATFNAFAEDVQQALNTPTPVAYGGTNAATPLDAANNLGVLSKQAQTFTNTEQEQMRSNLGLANGFPFMKVVDQKNPGVEGGASVVGSQVRVLNTVLTNNISGAALGTNSVFLPQGSYYAEASAPGFISGSHKIEILVGGLAFPEGSGTSEFSGTADATQTRSWAATFFTVASGGESLSILHRFSTARATNGLGVAANFGPGINEIYTELRIWKYQ